MTKKYVEYEPESGEIIIKKDVDGDGKPDITLKVRVFAIIKTKWPHITGIIAAGLAIAHMMGWL